jgi:hypothetical protein
MTRWASWERWWPLTAFAFVGLFIAGFAITDGSPDSQDDDGQIVSYFGTNGNQHRVIAAFLMILAASLLFVWFAAMLRGRLARADADGRWAALAFGSGVAAAVLWIAADALFAAPAMAANDTGKFRLDPNTFRVLNDASYALWFSGTTIALGLVAGTAFVALRAGLLPRWITWLSFPVAVSMLVSFFFIPFLVLCGWLLVVGVTLMLRKEAPETASSPATG